MTRKRIAEGVLLCLVLGVVGWTLVVYAVGVPAGAQYVGTSKCRLCHLKEYKTWSTSKHANNFDVLQGAERSNPDCVKCHTTGFNQAGGFVSEQATPDMKNTGCEACHGPGSAHVEAAKNAGTSKNWETKINKVPQNACVQCHNPHINQKERVAKLRAGG